MEGTNPLTVSEWLSILDWGFLVTNQVPPFKEWQHPLYLIKWEHIQHHVRKACPALTSDHVGSNPIITSERPSTHIHQHDRTQLLSSVKRHNTHIHQHGRTHLLPSMERHCTHIHQHGRTHLIPYVERHYTYNHQHDRTHLLSSVKRL